MINKKLIMIFGIIFLVGGVVYASGVVTFSSSNKGLVGHWSLNYEDYNPTTLKVTDKTPYENHGTNNGATFSTDRMGQTNGSMSFDGVGNYIDLPDDLGYSDKVSVFAWFKSSGNPAGNYHIIVGGQELEISVPSGTGEIRTGVYTNSRYVSNHGSGLMDGEWHHIGFTFNGTKKESYIDGVYVGGQDVSGSLTSSVPNRKIGRFGSSTTYYLNGLTDNLRIYDRALSATEVQSLYDSYRPKTIAESKSKGLVGHWVLDDSNYNFNTNRVTDKTPYENHGTNNGTTFSTDRMGQTNGSMSFDGVNDYVDVGDLAITEPATISMWIKPNDLSIDRRLFSQLSGSTGQSGSLAIRASTGCDVYDLCVWPGSGNWNKLIDRPSDWSGEWHHIVVTYSGNNATGYFDGVQDLTDAANGFDFNGVNAGIGAQFIGQYGSFFNGSISDVRIYDRALSEDEIKSLYDSYRPKAGSGSLVKGLVLDMPLKLRYTKSSTILTDRTPYSNDGVLTGATVGADYTSFDGVNDYVRASGFSDLGTSNKPYSFVGWFKAASGETDGNIIHMSSVSEGTGWCLPPVALDGGKIRGYSWPSNSVHSIITVTAGVWYHFVNTWDATNGLRIFVNGVLENSTTQSTYSASGSSNYIHLGFSPGGCAGNKGYFNGSITNTKIYNRALSSSEITLLYDKGRW